MSIIKELPSSEILHLPLKDRAFQIAQAAHQGKKRKLSGRDYFEHPKAVAGMLEKLGYSEEIIAAGYVHDVIDDTTVSAQALEADLGTKVLEITLTLSYNYSLPWEARKKDYLERLRQGPWEAKPVALEDKIHNAADIIIYYPLNGPKTWECFNHGKEGRVWFDEAVLTMFQETWEDPRIEIYAALVEELKGLK